eukprot:1387533-Rhodomonas_salina.1
MTPSLYPETLKPRTLNPTRETLNPNHAKQVLFDHEERTILRRLPLHVSSVKAMTWCPSNRSMASGGLDRDVLIWDPKVRRPAPWQRKHPWLFRMLQWTPDGQADWTQRA